jgi:hypothetical protein
VIKEKEKEMSYGDNRANFESVNMGTIEYDVNVFSQLVDAQKDYSARDVLELAERSQMITDTLNALYEQMKG